MVGRIDTRYLPGWLGYTDDVKLKGLFRELREIKEQRALEAIRTGLAASDPPINTAIAQNAERVWLESISEEPFEIAFTYDFLADRIAEDRGRRALGVMLKFPAVGALSALNRKYKYDFGLDACTSLPKLIEAIHERLDFLRAYKQIQELKKPSSEPG